MKIKNIMSKDVESVSPDTPLHEVAHKMRARDCGCVIVSKDDKLFGIITDRDIAIRCVAEERDPKGTKAEQVMSVELLYCHESDEATDVAQKMSQNKVRRLVVLDDEKRMVGIVSLGDLAMASDDHNICGTALSIICHPALVTVSVAAIEEKKPPN